VKISDNAVLINEKCRIKDNLIKMRLKIYTNLVEYILRVQFLTVPEYFFKYNELSGRAVLD
jgi:hypothetical protein